MSLPSSMVDFCTMWSFVACTKTLEDNIDINILVFSESSLPKASIFCFDKSEFPFGLIWGFNRPNIFRSERYIDWRKQRKNGQFGRQNISLGNKLIFLLFGCLSHDWKPSIGWKAILFPEVHDLLTNGQDRDQLGTTSTYSILTYVHQSFRRLKRVVSIGWMDALLCKIQIKWFRRIMRFDNSLGYFSE